MSGAAGRYIIEGMMWKKEINVRTVLLGVVLSVVFGMANAYLGLKIGMTVSASIPAAVVSMAVLRGLLKRGTVIENNMVQTIASSGESLAAGVIFTIPAFFFMNLPGFTIDSFKIFLYAMFGGLLGICFMVPMRRILIEKEHGVLKYPEGTACAQVLQAGEAGGEQARWVLWGGLAGLAYKFLASGVRLWNDAPFWPIQFKGAAWKSGVGLEATPALIGVGYIMGLRLCSFVFLGGALGWFVIMPLVPALVAKFPALVRAGPDILPVAQMSASQIWSTYIRYVGAGAVLMGGFLSIFKMIPTIYRSLRAEPKLLTFRMGESKDLPFGVILGLVAVAAVGMLFSPLHLNLLTVILVLVLSFLFVAVSARMVGLVGSSSNPISGMTIASLVIISALLFASGMRESEGMLTAMSAGAIVCIAAALAGDASQDLKTGYLVGSTPYLQQIAEFIGYIAPTFAIGATLFLLHETYHLGSPQLSAPQATIMSLVVRGIFEHTLPWQWMAIGAVLALGMEALRVPVLAFAVGLYLPVGLSLPLMLGGLAAHLTKQTEKGILLGSGLVAGDAVAGVLIAFFAWREWNLVPGFVSSLGLKAVTESPWVALALFLGLGYWVFALASEKRETAS